MKAKDLLGWTNEDLSARRESLKKDLFGYRMKNCLKNLENTGLIRNTRRDIARIEMVLGSRSGSDIVRSQS